MDAVTGLRNRVAQATAYASGFRVSEVVRLKVSSIDSRRMLIHIENGKGGRDRYAMLSPRLLDILRAYWMRARLGLAISRPRPRRTYHRPRRPSGLRAARRRARIAKPITVRVSATSGQRFR